MHKIRAMELRKPPSVSESLDWARSLVILNARPDSSILATRDIHLVISRGRLIDPDSLRASWPK